MLGYAARRLDRPADAADVIADVFMIAWRRIDQVPAGSDARPWLYGVARNVLSNYRRGARRRGRLADRLRSELEVNPAFAESPTAEVLTVRAALRLLSDDDRELLLLTCWEGLSPTEIAVAMGIPAVTVRSRLHRARHHLREGLGTDHRTPSSKETNERLARSGHVSNSEHPLAADHKDLR